MPKALASAPPATTGPMPGNGEGADADQQAGQATEQATGHRAGGGTGRRARPGILGDLLGLLSVAADDADPFAFVARVAEPANAAFGGGGIAVQATIDPPRATGACVAFLHRAQTSSCRIACNGMPDVAAGSGDIPRTSHAPWGVDVEADAEVMPPTARARSGALSAPPCDAMSSGHPSRGPGCHGMMRGKFWDGTGPALSERDADTWPDVHSQWRVGLIGPMEAHDAHCSDRAALPIGPAGGLRRDRAGRLAADRGAGPPRARRHALRQRRLVDDGAPDPDRRHRALARGGGPRPAGLLGDHRRPGVRPRRRGGVRRRPLAPGLPRLRLRLAGGDADGDDPARAAGPAGPAAPVRPLPDDAGDLDLRQPAGAAARAPTGRARSTTRSTPTASSSTRGAAATWPGSGASPPRRGWTAPSGSPSARASR